MTEYTTTRMTMDEAMRIIRRQPPVDLGELSRKLARLAREAHEQAVRRAHYVTMTCQAQAEREVVEPLDADEATVWALGHEAITSAGPDERAAMVRASYLLTYGYPAEQVAAALVEWAEAWPYQLGTAPELDYYGDTATHELWLQAHDPSSWKARLRDGRYQHACNYQGTPQLCTVCGASPEPF